MRTDLSEFAARRRRWLLGLTTLPWLGACAARPGPETAPVTAPATAGVTAPAAGSDRLRPAPVTAPRADDDADGSRLAAVIAGAQRGQANRARDAARHPFETLRFFGLRPSQQVLEIAPGAGWYTEILAPYLREHGRLYAALGDPATVSPAARQARQRFTERFSADVAPFGVVGIAILPVDDRGFVDTPAPGSIDRVLTFRNIHNWLEAGHLDQTLRACHAVLRPGGMLGVVEHRAPAGTTVEQSIASGYVTEALVIERATAAGLRLDGRSEINANPRDDRQHPNGVWSLPPTLRGGDVDRARFVAIGESDRMTLRFVKPSAPGQ